MEEKTHEALRLAADELKTVMAEDLASLTDEQASDFTKGEELFSILDVFSPSSVPAAIAFVQLYGYEASKKGGH